MKENEEGQVKDLGLFESDFTWSDDEIIDDTESLFFGGINKKHI